MAYQFESDRTNDRELANTKEFVQRKFKESYPTSLVQEIHLDSLFSFSHLNHQCRIILVFDSTR
ncbi:hypothetical protein SDC9_103170 [bioreactor metagenome]|uniref:Uncharacterized protein n=1 Tax=bioreactor metagenome TaxID=1076179 RepID=A0A645AUC5_9ZZZZ